jgi:hypothetical protein
MFCWGVYVLGRVGDVRRDPPRLVACQENSELRGIVTLSQSAAFVGYDSLVGLGISLTLPGLGRDLGSDTQRKPYEKRQLCGGRRQSRRFRPSPGGFAVLITSLMALGPDALAAPAAPRPS